MALPNNLLICRTCVLKSPSLAKIFGDEGTLGFSIAGLINELLELDVSPGDGLPDRICCNCLNELARFKRFKNICHKAKDTLEYIVKKENADVSPQVIKEGNSAEREAIENSAVEIVDLDDSSEDDDSGAETVCAPSPPPICISSDDSSNESCQEMLEKSEITILSEPSTSSAAAPAVPSTSEERTSLCISASTAVFLPFEKSLEDKVPYYVEEVLNAEDPLDVKLRSSSESGDENALCLETDVDIMHVEEDESPFDVRIKREDHCSRTLGWTRKSTKPVNLPGHSSVENAIENITKGSSSGSSRKSTVNMVDWHDRNTEEPISHTYEHRKCPRCSEKFESDLELVNHVQKKDCQPLNCFFCTKLLFRRQLQEHLEVCTEKPLPYTCVICKKSFKRLESLIAHQASHSKDKNSVCFICGQFFPMKKMLRMHRKTCKSLEAVRSRLLFPILRCGECVSAFTRTSSLLRHLKNENHTNCICGECGDEFLNLHSLCAHIQASHEHWCYKCPYCPRKFVESHRFSEHLARCPVTNSFECKWCKKHFKSKNCLKEHVRKSH